MTSGGRVRLDAMSSAFLSYADDLRSVPEMETLPRDKSEAGVQLGRLLRPMRSGTHPLRWMVMASWLFEGGTEFLSTLKAPQEGCEQSDSQTEHLGLAQEGVPQDFRQADRDRVIHLMGDGSSATFAAHEAGVSVQTAMAWAAQAGIPSKRRPKQLVQAKREQVTADLLQGLGKAEVAAKRSVSVQMITRVLQSEVGLHAAWTSKRFDNARQDARARWLALLNEHAALGTKLMRSLEPAAYAWLYRHDRAWLQEHRPERLQASEPRRSSVNWDERDLMLRAKVREAIVQLASRSGKRPIQLWQVVQVVPELKPKLRALDRLPLTREALQQAIAQRAKSSPSQNSLPF
ncbi:hypothetical protein NBRC116584_29910 [Hydrogenophaga sp. 5NK40-0174]